MLTRTALRSLGLAARPLTKQSTTAIPVPVFLNTAALYKHLQPKRLSSYSASSPSDEPNLPHLPKPWKLRDLTMKEQRAYKQHGPDYIRHLPEDLKKRALRAAEFRVQRAKELEETLGPDWYNIRHEAERRFDTQEPAVMEEFKRKHGVEDIFALPINRETVKAWNSVRKEKRDAISLEVKEEWSQRAA